MNLFILTGAGVSAESGLGVFRGPGAALWKRYDPMQLATPEAFARDPAPRERDHAVMGAGDIGTVNPPQCHFPTREARSGIQRAATTIVGVVLDSRFRGNDMKPAAQ